MSVELTDLRYFYNVATSGSFTRGAQLSHVTTPAISKSIKRLEEALDVTLLHRTTRSLSLTEAGELVLAHCERMLKDLGDLRLELDRAGSVVRGPLRIGTMEALSIFALPRALSRMHREHPAVRSKAFVMGPEDIEERILKSELDLGLRMGSGGKPGLRRTALIRSPGSLVCGRGHPLFEGQRITPTDLQQHDFVVTQFFGREYLPPSDCFPDARFPRRIGATAELLQMAIQMVVDGEFLGYFPDISIRCQLNHDELRRLDGLTELPGFELFAVTREGATQKPAAELLVEYVRDALRDALALECAP